MNDGINHDIGGTADEYTQRGFAVYGRVTDSRGCIVRVQRSSAVGGPYCYVFTANPDGLDHAAGIAGAPNGVVAAAPHLDAAQARELAALLTRFADDAEGVTVACGCGATKDLCRGSLVICEACVASAQRARRSVVGVVTDSKGSERR